MNSRDDAAYRLDLAKGYLVRAEKEANEEQWDGCLADAQEAVENAGKSVLSFFRPVPRTHDVIEPLEQLLELDAVPESVKQKILPTLNAFQNMGIETHVRATYGSELTRTPPWELIKEPEATAGLDKARRAVKLAEDIFAEMMKPPDEKEVGSSE